MITGREASTLEQAVATMTEAPLTPQGVVCDVARADQIQQVVDQLQQQHGRIDTLINVAGVNRRKPSLEVTEEDYDFIVDINVFLPIQVPQTT